MSTRTVAAVVLAALAIGLGALGFNHFSAIASSGKAAAANQAALPTEPSRRYDPLAASQGGSGQSDQQDLYSEVTSLLPQSESGDPSASFRIAQIYEECWQFAVDPSGFDSDIAVKSKIRKDLATKLQIAQELVIRKCRRFAGQAIGPGAIGKMVERAASQGNLAAQTRLLAQRVISGTASPIEFEAAVNQVADSRDPEAFTALAPVIGRASAGSQSSLAPIPAGTDLAEAAWNVAACRLGRDCGSTSPAVIQMCLGGGINCELRDIESFYRQGVLPPAEALTLEQLVHRLVQGTKP